MYSRLVCLTNSHAQNQEALAALASRAQRAEARLRVLEARNAEESTESVEGSPLAPSSGQRLRMTRRKVTMGRSGNGTASKFVLPVPRTR